MLKKFISSFVVMTMLLSTSACAQTNGYGSGGNSQIFGTILGAGAGGLLGSRLGSGSGRTAAIIGLGALGAVAGSAIGGNMDRQNQSYQPYTNQQNVIVERHYYPQNQGYNNNNNRFCRQYQKTVMTPLGPEVVYGTMCPDQYGNYHIAD